MSNGSTRRLLLATFLAGSLASPPAPAFDADYWEELMERGIAHWQRSDLKAAAAAFAEATRQSLGRDADRRVTSLNYQAEVLRELGRHGEAEQLLLTAIAEIERVPGQVQADKAVLFNNLATLRELAGDPAGAGMYYRRALAVRDGAPGSRTEDRLALLLNLAGLAERQGNDEEALVWLGQADPLANARGLPSLAAAHFHNTRGMVKARRPDHGQEALADFRRALGLAENGAPPLVAASIRHNLGSQSLAMGDLATAEGELDKALAIRREKLGDHHRDTIRTLFSSAAAAARRQRTAEALAASQGAVAGLAAVLSEGNGLFSQAERRAWRDGYINHLRILLAHPTLPRDQRNEDAFQVIQQAKYTETGRVFAAMSARFAAGATSLSESVRQMEETSRALKAREEALVQHLSSQGKPDRDRESLLRRAVADARKELAGLVADTARRYPDYHELVSGSTAPSRLIQGHLGPDEALLAFLFGDDEGYLAVATRESLALHRLPVGREALQQSVARLRATVDPEKVVDEPPPFPADEAHRLYQVLLAPAASLLDGKAVWHVVPDGPLESLPLSLLIASPPPPRAAYPDLDWVVRRHALSTLPGIGALATLRRTAQPSPAAEPLLAMADPVLGSGSGGQRRVSLRSLTGGKRLADPAQIRKLVPLPETADEARAIAGILGRGEVYTREEATEGHLKRLDLTRYRHLLFATHGALAGDFADFGEPALILTPPESATEMDDGLLSASEIAQLKLNADWVLLSACNTAASDGSAGSEGFSGLSKAFFHAGARSLLVSHWPVASDATVLITTGAFKALADKPGLDKARALRQSMLSLLDGPEKDFAHPMFWAPFVLVGDSR